MTDATDTSIGTYPTVADAVANSHADNARVLRRGTRPEFTVRDTFIRIDPDGDVWVLRHNALGSTWTWIPMYEVP